jgi:hypothetical protein
MQKVEGSSPFIRLGFLVSLVPLICPKRVPTTEVNAQ